MKRKIICGAIFVILLVLSTSVISSVQAKVSESNDDEPIIGALPAISDLISSIVFGFQLFMIFLADLFDIPLS